MSATSPHILCIDQSTSATKALLFDATGALLGKTSLEHRQIYPAAGWVEHDADEIWQNVGRAVTTLLTGVPEDSSKPICLSITNQRETFVVFDRQTGVPLRNAIVWQCRRGEQICKELIAAGLNDVVRMKTGLRIDTYFSGAKIAWIMRNDPAIAQQIQRGDALIGTIDSYLVYRLTNGKVFATDHTNASRTLLYDIATLKWDDGLCEIFGVPRAALPEVWESSGQFGETNISGALKEAVPICGVIGDSQAALFANRCFQPGSAKVTFGTGSSVLLNIGASPRAGADGVVTSLAWVRDGEATYCYEGIINYSAATLAWLRDRLGLFRDFAEVEPMAKSVPDNGGVYVVPAFVGLGAPYWDPAARAAIVGLSASSQREHIVRAALESIAYQVRDVLEMMRSGAGVSLAAIHADGGASSNRTLMQFTADMVGIEVKPAEVPECSALGATMMGALGMGAVKSLDDLARQTQSAASFHPALDAETVNHNYHGWQRAVASVLTVHRLGDR